MKRLVATGSVGSVIIALAVMTHVVFPSGVPLEIPSAPSVAPGPTPGPTIEKPRPGDGSLPMSSRPFDSGKTNLRIPASVANTSASMLYGGHLIWPVDLDSDRDPATNPLLVRPVPAIRVSPGNREIKAASSSLEGSQNLLAPAMIEVKLGVEVLPQQSAQNPAGVMVSFHVWSADHSIDLTRQARSDVWGAASVEVPLTALDLNQKMFYTASAPGFGELPVRPFRVSSDLYTIQLYGARVLTPTQAASAAPVVNIETDLLMDDNADAATLVIAHASIPASPTDKAGFDFLSPVKAKRLDAHHAQAQLDLPPGSYIVKAIANSGKTRMHSKPIPVQIKATSTNPLAQVDSGDARGAMRADDKPILIPQTTRLGAFKWRTETYSMSIQTEADDHKKRISLQGFSYDPMMQTYEIAVQSLLTNVVEDKITLQALGPNNVVIYEETAPITLDPAEPLHYRFTVPARYGEPKGLRVIVHDPIIQLIVFDPISVLLTAFVANLVVDIAGINADPEDDGFSLALKVELGINVVDIPIIYVGILCDLKLFVPAKCTPYSGGLIVDALTSPDPQKLRDDLIDGLNKYVQRYNFRNWDEAYTSLTTDGIYLGGSALQTPLTVKYIKNLVDPNCSDAAAKEQAKIIVSRIGNRLDSLATQINTVFLRVEDKLKEVGRDPASFNLGFTGLPGFQFVVGRIEPELKRAQIKAGATPDYSGLAFELGTDVSLGFNFYVKLPLDFYSEFTKLGRLAKGVLGSLFDLNQIKIFTLDIFRVFSALPRVGQGGSCWKGGGSKGGSAGTGGGKKGGNPDGSAPFPWGSPDDRLDAFQTGQLPEPSGASGQEFLLQQQLALAQTRGLNRAAAFYTYSLRQQQLQTFQTDATRFISYTQEISTAIDSALSTGQALVSGTLSISSVLPLSPTATLTDALSAVLDNLGVAMNNTQYDQQRRQLQDSVDFAQRQYFALRGQELELQNELRLLNGGVGILDTGLSTYALGAVGTIGVSPKPIHILPGDFDYQGFADYVAPFEAPPVVIVPTGGLNRYQGNEQARAWLEAYVVSGGTLIVLTQYENDDWTLLPGGEVAGLGYKDDILCNDQSVHIINPSIWIAGVDRDYPNIQIDGSFTHWPSNATLVWMRRTGNQMPAMIEYPFGAGRVVATAAYPDFYINGMQSQDDVAFARSLFGEAYLQANAENVVATVTPNQSVSFATTLTNDGYTTATTALVFRDYYENRIAESWRWAAHAPNFASAGVTFNSLNPVLPMDQSRNTSLAFSAPPYAGIFRTAIGLSENGYSPMTTIPGPFYQVRSQLLGVNQFNASLTTEQPSYVFGAQATLTATLRNDRAVARTFVISPEAGLSGPAMTLTAAPNSTVTQVYVTAVTASRDVRLIVNENGAPLSALIATLKLRLPSIGLSFAPTQVAPGVTTTVRLTASATSLAAGTPVLINIRQNNTLIYSSTVPLIPTGGVLMTQADATLPAAAPGDAFVVHAELPQSVCLVGSCSTNQTIAVGRPIRLDGLSLANALSLGDVNAGGLKLRLLGQNFGATTLAQASLLDSASTLTTGASKTVATAANNLQIVALELPLPAQFQIGQPYNAIANLTTQVSGSPIAYPISTSLTFTPQPPGLSLGESTRRVGQPLSVLLSNIVLAPYATQVSLPAATPFTATLTGPNGFSQSYAVLDSVALGNGSAFTFTVPEVMQGGRYNLNLSTSALPGWSSSADFNINAQRVTLSAPATATAGQTLPITLQNEGGVSTLFSGTLNLLDSNGQAQLQIPISTSLAPAALFTTSLPVPTQLQTSPNYRISLVGVDHLGAPVNAVSLLDITGLNVSLASLTDRVAYLSTDVVSTTSTINTNVPLAGATLRLRVLKAAISTGAIDWKANLANAGATNFVSQPIQGSVSTAWSAAQGSYNNFNPVSVGALVFVVNSSAQMIEAHNSTTGALVWQSSYADYGFSVSNLAANNTAVFILINRFVVAFDTLTGAVVWTQQIFGNTNSLLVSDTALAVQAIPSGGDSTMGPIKVADGYSRWAADISPANPSYALLDPATGALRGYVPTSEFALLAGTTLFVYGNGYTNFSDLAAYDATTGAEFWRNPNAGHTLIAANASYVLTSDGASLYIHAATNGALLRTAALDPNSNLTGYTNAQHAILNGNSFYYFTNIPGGGCEDCPGSFNLFKIDLATGNQTPFYSQVGYDVRAMLGTGNLIHLLKHGPAPRSIITLDEAGTVLADQDISAIAAPTLLGLSTSGQGLIVATDQGITALNTAGSAGALTGDTNVLREELIPVSGSGTLVLERAFLNPSLTDDPRARGTLYLQGVLLSAEPQTLADVNQHQVLAVSQSAFTIDDAAGSVILNADRASYRHNVAGYAGDDALATVHLSGVARNTNAVPTDIALTVSRSDGVVIFSQVYPGVAAGDGIAFTTSDANPPTGVLSYTASTSIGGVAVATALVRDVHVNALATFDRSTIALGESVRLDVRLQNANANEPGFVTLNWGSDQTTVVLEPGQTLTVGRSVTPTQAGLFNVAIGLSGDATGTLTPGLPVDVRAESVSALTALVGLTRTDTILVQTNEAALAVSINNTNSYTVAVNVAYEIHSDPIVGSVYVNLVPNSGTVLTVPVNSLDIGNHTAAFTITDAQRGSVVAVLSFPFSIVTPQSSVSLSASAGALASQQIPLDVRVTNAMTSDLAWVGSLVLEGALDVRTDVMVNPGQTLVFSPTLDVSNLAGGQMITASLMSADGIVIAQQLIRVDAAPRYALAARLVSLAASSGTPGSTITLTATLDNPGPAGDALLTFVAFDQRVEQTVAVPEFGQAQATWVVTAPSDLLAGVYPALARLTAPRPAAQEAHADVALAGPVISLEQSLDAAAYGPFSNANYSVVLRGISGAPAPYEVTLRYHGDEYSQTVMIGAGSVVPVAFALNVGPVSDRATVLVSNHPATAAAQRHTLLIDSLWVPVIEDERAWLQSDKPGYQAGETVQLTLHLLKPTPAALVLGPTDSPTNTNFILWSSADVLAAHPDDAMIRGDFPMSYPLPATMRTGRYFFSFLFDGEVRYLPIDVHGVNLRTEAMQVIQPDPSLSSGDLLTVSAQFRLDVPVANALIEAYALTPDLQQLSLGSNARVIRNLPAGTTSIVLNGFLNSAQYGSHQIVLKVRDAATYAELGGDARFVEVGRAGLTSLSTDHGVYQPGQPALGQISLYSTGEATVSVKTSGGTLLLNQAISTPGHQRYTFTPPTASVMDEVLIGTLTDSSGATSTLQSAYRVAATFDITAPLVLVQSPALPTSTTTRKIVFSSPADQVIQVTGIVTENRQMGTVRVNGETAILTGNQWSAPVTLTTGLNTIGVYAIDEAGNIGFATTSVIGEPGFGVSLSLAPPMSQVGDTLTAAASITASQPATISLVFPFSRNGFAPFAGSASSGILTTTLTTTDPQVIWSGSVVPGTPVTISWIATATSAMTGTAYAVAQMAGFSEPSNGVPFEIRPRAATATPTATPSSTPSPTPSNTATPTTTPSSTPSPTPSNTATGTATPTSANTPTRTPTSTPMNTVTPTPTQTPSPSPTPSMVPTLTKTATPAPTLTATQTPAATSTKTATPSRTPTATLTRTLTKTATPTQTPSRTPTKTATPTPTVTATPPTACTPFGTAGKYNVFILENLNTASMNIAGSVAVGRDATFASFNISGDVVVGRDVNGASGTVQGKLIYGRNNNTIPNSFNALGGKQQGSPINFDSEAVTLTQLSNSYAALSANGNVANSFGTLTLAGTNAQRNVFVVTSAQLQIANGIVISVPQGSSVIVNVTGSAVTMSNFAITLKGVTAARVLWNLSSTTSLTVANLALKGSLLMPKGLLNTSSGNFEGVIIARQWNGSSAGTVSNFQLCS